MHGDVGGDNRMPSNAENTWIHGVKIELGSRWALVESIAGVNSDDKKCRQHDVMQPLIEHEGPMSWGMWSSDIVCLIWVSDSVGY